MKTLLYHTRSFFLLTFVASLISTHVFGQKRRELKNILDTVIVQAKARSINSPNVNWEVLEAKIRHQARHAKTIGDLTPSLELLLEGIDDRAGVFSDFVSKKEIVRHPNFEQGKSAVSLMSLEYRILPDGIRYLRLPTIAQEGNVYEQAYAIRQAISSLKPEESEGWILDLRYATGANAVPIIAGLSPLLGEGLMTTTINSQKKIQDLYSIHNGRLYINHKLMVDLPSGYVNLKTCKIAVLMGNATGAAGELTTIILKGRKQTKFFGERTAGDVYASSPVVIGNTIVMSIADIQYLDRRGTTHKGKLTPDVTIGQSKANASDRDPAIATATVWLKGIDLDNTAVNVAAK